MSGSPEEGTCTYVPLTAVYITNRKMEDRNHGRLAISAGSPSAYVVSSKGGSKIFESFVDDVYYIVTFV